MPLSLVIFPPVSVKLSQDPLTSCLKTLYIACQFLTELSGFLYTREKTSSGWSSRMYRILPSNCQHQITAHPLFWPKSIAEGPLQPWNRPVWLKSNITGSKVHSLRKLQSQQEIVHATVRTSKNIAKLDSTYRLQFVSQSTVHASYLNKLKGTYTH